MMRPSSTHNVRHEPGERAVLTVFSWARHARLFRDARENCTERKNVVSARAWPWAVAQEACWLDCHESCTRCPRARGPARGRCPVTEPWTPTCTCVPSPLLWDFRSTGCWGVTGDKQAAQRLACRVDTTMEEPPAASASHPARRLLHTELTVRHFQAHAGLQDTY